MDRLHPDSSLLFIIDVQERLLAAMSPVAQTRVIGNTGILIEAARVLGVRVLVTEQYPKGLGSTAPALKEKLALMGERAATPLPKMDFDAMGDATIAREVHQSEARQIVVVGMETHVCVFQTARELARRGYDTYVVADGVASRTEENRTAGLRLCERAGATVTVTETVAFDWLRRAGTDHFKQISKLLK